MQLVKRILRAVLVLAAFGPSSALGQDYSYEYAYLSRVEGEVSLQRASEPQPEEGTRNLPVLPGDRVWTLGDSRAEVRFADGSALRLSENAKIDFVDLGSETILRVWSGSVILELVEPRESLRIDTAAGTVRPTREGSYRIDVVDEEQVALFVTRGSAELANSRGSVLVQSGEASDVSAGGTPAIPARFNTASLDDFARWSESLDRAASSASEVIVRSLPHEVRSYANELDDYGDWDRDPDYGYVWYPQVSFGWAPYTYGSWWHAPFGYTWISHEPWGWAPYHYGRWGYKSRGWFWIPGASWGPAWVSFAIGPTWIGWNPLGFHNRPVFVFDSFHRHRWGWAGRRHWNGHRGGGWNFCDRDDFRRGVVTRNGYRRIDPDFIRRSGDVVRVLDEPTATSAIAGVVGARTAQRRDAIGRSDAVNRRGVIARREAIERSPRTFVSPGDSSAAERRARPSLEPRTTTRRLSEGASSGERARSRFEEREVESQHRAQRRDPLARDEEPGSERRRGGFATPRARERSDESRTRGSVVAEPRSPERASEPHSRERFAEPRSRGRVALPRTRDRSSEMGSRTPRDESGSRSRRTDSLGSSRERQRVIPSPQGPPPGMDRPSRDSGRRALPSMGGQERGRRSDPSGGREMSRGRSQGSERSSTGSSSMRGRDRGNRGSAGSPSSSGGRSGAARSRSNRSN